jgi:hypothetical protein
MTVGELRERYIDVFGEETRSQHKDFLRKRIAWRIQALAEGGLSERAKRRAEEIANDADLRIRTPRDPVKPGLMEVRQRSVTGRLLQLMDTRLPLPGTLLVREFQGRDIVVKVLDKGFEYDGRHFKSLSAIAQEAEEASRPNLRGNKGSYGPIQPNQGSGRQGTDYKQGSGTQVKSSSPAFPLLSIVLLTMNDK